MKILTYKCPITLQDKQDAPPQLKLQVSDEFVKGIIKNQYQSLMPFIQQSKTQLSGYLPDPRILDLSAIDGQLAKKYMQLTAKNHVGALQFNMLLHKYLRTARDILITRVTKQQKLLSGLTKKHLMQYIDTKIDQKGIVFG